MCKSQRRVQGVPIRGVAAVEFALILLFMATVLVGLFFYWYMLQTHQSVTRATGDGARYLQEIAFSGDAAMTTNPTRMKQSVEQVVRSSLQEAGLEKNPQVNVEWSSGVAVLTVEYPSGFYTGMDGVGTPELVDRWGLEKLRSSSVIALP